MFTLLDFLNHYLGFFSTNSQTKGKIYSIISSVGIWYVLYLAVRFLENGRWLRGLALVAAFLILFYFTVLNVLYYFTNKQLKYDISPKIEKVLGGPDARPNETRQVVQLPTNGLYRKEQLLPTLLTQLHQENIEKIMAMLSQHHGLTMNYGDLSAEKQAIQVRQHQYIARNYPGTVIPSAELIHENGELVLLGGENTLNLLPIATITRVGLLSASEAYQRFNLVAANVVIMDKIQKRMGRSGLIEDNYAYDVILEVAFSEKRELND